MNDLSCFVLPNGLRIPSIAYGTWQIPAGTETESAVKEALRAGYRHIDTAAAYGNDFSAGEAIAAGGFDRFDRRDIFIANKLWINKRGYDNTLKAFRQTLKRMYLDYLDLYLIHWPASYKLYDNWKKLNLDTWRAFETLYKDGFIKAIGVSNFTPFYLEPLIEGAEIKPMVNQIEYHPGQKQGETVFLCTKNDILVEAWSPLGSGRILQREELCAVAKKYDKSAAQVCIRWCLQKNILPIPKSKNPERIRQNREVFDFTLSPDDLSLIDGLPYFGGSGNNPDDFELGLSNNLPREAVDER
jgi:diketogulonate reductase-like aldo/keto reductase